jgi:hypothetical protein
MNRVTIKVRKKSGQGGADNPSESIAYLAREGRYAPGVVAREVGYLDRSTEALRDRDDLVWKEAGNMPSWARNDPYVFFEAAHDHERRNGRWAMAMEVALPRDLTREQQREMVETYLQAHFARHPYFIVQHEPVASDGLRQPHCHLLVSERLVDDIEREPAQFFRRWNGAHPEKGGARKEQVWQAKEAAWVLRETWYDLTNAAMEKRGVDRRDNPHRKERDVGFGGGKNPERQRAVREARAVGAEREQQEAARYWEERKQQLGVTDVRQLDRAWWCERIREQVEQVREIQAARRTRGQARGREARGEYEKVLSTAAARVSVELRRAERDAREGRATSWHDAEKQDRAVVEADRVLAQREKGVTALERERELLKMGAPLIGNKRSGIYHVPGDPNYGDVFPQHQAWFWSAEEAEAAGYRRARNQHRGMGETEPMSEALAKMLMRGQEQGREQGQEMERGRMPGRGVEVPREEQVRGGIRVRLDDPTERGRSRRV